MANDFFNDTLPPFVGIDIGWDQDPNFPIGEYTVVSDAPVTTSGKFRLYQTVDDDGKPDGHVSLTEGVLMNTIPAVAGEEGSFDAADGNASWSQVGDRFAVPTSDNDGNPVPLRAQDLDAGEGPLSLSTTGKEEGYGFWIELKSLGEDPNTKASPASGDVGAVGHLVIEEIDFTTSAPKFIGSREYNKFTDGSKLVKKLGEGGETHPVIFLGSATVEKNDDNEMVATFTQDTFGPITIPTISYLSGIISEGTLLQSSSTDGGISVKSLLSKGNNNLFESSDGTIKYYLNAEEGSRIALGGSNGDYSIAVDGTSADAWDAKANAADDTEDVDHTH